MEWCIRNVHLIHSSSSSPMCFQYPFISPTGVSQASTVSSGPLGNISTVGNLRRFSFSTDNLTGSWDIRVNSNDRYSLKVIGQYHIP